MHPVLKAYALGGSIEIMQEYTMRSLALNDDIDIDVECYNWLLRVIAPSPFPSFFLSSLCVCLVVYLHADPHCDAPFAC